MEGDQDQIGLKSVEVFDPIQKRRYNVFVQEDNLEILQPDGNSDNEEDENLLAHENIQEPSTTWSQNETLALINIFSLHKEKFKNFKIKKDRWKLVSRELAKIGIDKLPQKCEIKWRNLLRTYRIYKSCDKSQGKFEFFNELDDIISNDPHYKYLYESASCSNSALDKNALKSETKTDIKVKPIHLLQTSTEDSTETQIKKRKCFTCKSEKQKRHEERMLLLKKKMELEERKVKAFEDYVHFLKSTHGQN